eukprot:7388593-Prymnesium_polylepis.1
MARAACGLSLRHRDGSLRARRRRRPCCSSAAEAAPHARTTDWSPSRHTILPLSAPLSSRALADGSRGHARLLLEPPARGAQGLGGTRGLGRRRGAQDPPHQSRLRARRPARRLLHPVVRRDSDLHPANFVADKAAAGRRWSRAAAGARHCVRVAGADDASGATGGERGDRRRPRLHKRGPPPAVSRAATVDQGRLPSGDVADRVGLPPEATAPLAAARRRAALRGADLDQARLLLVGRLILWRRHDGGRGGHGRLQVRLRARGDQGVQARAGYGAQRWCRGVPKPLLILSHASVACQIVGMLGFLFWVEVFVAAMLTPWAFANGEGAKLLGVLLQGEPLGDHDETPGGKASVNVLLLWGTAAFGGVRIYTQFAFLNETSATSLAISNL